MLTLRLHGYGRFDERASIGPSIWSHFDLLYFHEGSAALEIDPGHREHFDAGEGILLYPQTQFRGRAKTETLLASVQHFLIDPPASEAAELPRPLDRLYGKRRGYYPLRGHVRTQIEADIDRAMRLAEQGDAPEVRVIRQSLLLIILAQLLKKPSPFDENAPYKSGFGDLLRWAQDNFHRGVTVSTLASMANLSESHFRARFAREIGISAGKYLRLLRLNEAKRLLRETREPVKGIARRLGYSDVVAFHRAFKNHESITPSQYRDRYAPRG